METLDRRAAVVLIHPNNHPSTEAVRDGISPGLGNFLVEFPFDTTRAALNLLFNGVLERFPGIRFILCHAGGALPYLAWRVAEIASRQMSVAPWDKQYPSPFMEGHAGNITPELVLAQIGRFWFETALAAGPTTFGALKALADPERIVFGSDWPYCPDVMTRDMLAALASVDLSEEGREAVERGNALRLFPRFA